MYLLDRSGGHPNQDIIIGLTQQSQPLSHRLWYQVDNSYAVNQDSRDLECPNYSIGLIPDHPCSVKINDEPLEFWDGISIIES